MDYDLIAFDEDLHCDIRAYWEGFVDCIIDIKHEFGIERAATFLEESSFWVGTMPIADFEWFRSMILDTLPGGVIPIDEEYDQDEQEETTEEVSLTPEEEAEILADLEDYEEIDEERASKYGEGYGDAVIEFMIICSVDDAKKILGRDGDESLVWVDDARGEAIQSKLPKELLDELLTIYSKGDE